MAGVDDTAAPSRKQHLLVSIVLVGTRYAHADSVFSCVVLLLVIAA